MKAAAIIIGLLLALPAAASDLLAQIAVVEDWRGRVGRAGELGPYQMLPGTRADRLADLRRRGHACPSERQLAQEHIAWLTRQLVRAGIDPNHYNLALCWNAGLAQVLAGRAPLSRYRYAARVVALEEDAQ